MARAVIGRIWSLDILRGILILIMVIAHSIFFFHTDTDPLLQAVQWSGDFVSFTGLLFLSGAAGYIAYIHFDHPPGNVTTRVLKRLIWYFLGYWLLALWAHTVRVGYSTESAIQIITFRQFPPFTEFIIPFLFFGITKTLLRPLYQLISSSILYITIASLFVYGLSVLLYGLEVSDVFLPLKALFVGHPGIYTFPILSYAPVYFIGLYIGRALWMNKSKFLPLPNLNAILLTLGASAFIGRMVTHHPDIVFSRWPPGPGFIIASVSITIGGLLLIRKTNELKLLGPTRLLLLLIGQNAFALFFGHTAVLFLYQALSLPKTSSPAFVFYLTIASLVLGVYIARFVPANFRFGLEFIKWCECKLGHCTHESHSPRVLQAKITLSEIARLPVLAAIPIGNIKLPIFTYWIPLVATSIVTIFGIAAITRASDTRVIQTPGQTIVQTGPVVTSDESETALQLPISPTLSPEQINEQQSVIDQLRSFLFDTKRGSYKSIVESTIGITNRKWFVTTQSDSEVQYTIPIRDATLLSETEIRVLMRIDDEVVGAMRKSQNGWSGHADLTQLPTGRHTLTALVETGNRAFITKPSEIIISAPVFVAWTHDWEGTDVPDTYLDAIVTISDEFDLVSTHLFNPRVYTSDDVSQRRAQQLTDWVISRRELARDEIGMHLHMWPDFLQEAGIQPKNGPKWGAVYGTGYDVLTTAYTYEDMVAALSYGRSLMEENGLGTPISYRAGGWFADEMTLQALVDSGFIIDSSARNAYTLGNKPGPWDVGTTTLPYHPSESDQNSSDPPPRLPLLEIPNNGGDTYAFSSQELIDKFRQNYNGEILSSPKQVTFLSHPNWFDDRKQRKVRELVEHISQWSYIQDRGPVVYATLSEIKEVFDPQ